MGVVRGDHLGGVGEGAKSVWVCSHERHHATSALEFKPRGDVDQDDRRPRRPACQQMRAEHGHASQRCTYDGRGGVSTLKCSRTASKSVASRSTSYRPAGSQSLSP